MITLLAKIFIKEEDSQNKKRGAYGMLCAVVGIFLNLCLFTGKLVAGLISHSIAITADAFNNLSDAGSSVISLIGFKLAGQKPDKEHPYGHGRMEYISGMIISGIILLMGYELIVSSVKKIIHPETVQFSALVLVILILSIFVKCYMAFYNHNIGKKIDSATVKAVAMDSLSDCIATSVVLIATLVGHFTKYQIDGYCGVLVGLFILYAGFNAAKETVDALLGKAVDEDYLSLIEDLVLDFDKNIVGVHDLMVHDYGPGRKIISLHVEVPAEGDILELHDIIDNLEQKMSKDLDCLATIHMDPVITKDPRVDALKIQVQGIVSNIGSELGVHDFRVVFGNTHTNLIFDVEVPFGFQYTEDEVESMVKKAVRTQIGENHFAVIHMDKK